MKTILNITLLVILVITSSTLGGITATLLLQKESRVSGDSANEKPESHKMAEYKTAVAEIQYLEQKASFTSYEYEK